MTRIHVIEDHQTLVVAALRSLFRPNRDGIVVESSSGTVEEMTERVLPGSIDLIILDLYIPGTTPKKNIRMLKQTYPGIPIIIFSNEKSMVWVIRMRKEGAHGYLFKDAGRDELKMAILKTAAGKYYFPDMRTASKYKPIRDDSVAFKKLTPDQQNIIRLLVQGLFHEEIATHLGQSRSAIEKKLSELRSLFDVRTNVELVHLLNQSGQV
jgi:DNA-binding NarL/FixJ family response regulator